ncbi:MAG: hypothetical protein ACRCU1_14065 [Alsobacter sp.]
MTPEEAEVLRLRLKDPNAPDTRSVGDRIIENAGRMADNPIIRYAALGPGLGGIAAGLPSMMPSDEPPPPPTLGPLQAKLRGYQSEGDAAVSVSTPMTLRAHNTPDVNVQAAPTLDPRYGQTMVPQRLGGGGGVGLGGLQGNLDAARKRQDGLLDTEASLAREQGIDQAGRAMAVSDMEQDEAARQQADADRQAKINEEASSRQRNYLDTQDQRIEELGKMKVDPRRLFRNADDGTKFSMWTGAILGGMLGAEHGTGNTSLDRLEKIIDRDVKVQQDEIDNKRTSIAARQTMIGADLALAGDNRVAAASHRLLLLEAAKLSLKSKADALGVPEMRTRAEIVANGIEQKQAGLRTQIAEGALRAAQAAAGAAAAAREKAERDAREWSLKIAELGLKKDELEIKRTDAIGKGGKEDDAAISEASKRLGDDKVIANRGLIRSMQERIRGDGTVVGLDRGAAMREKLVRWLPTSVFLDDDQKRRIALSSDELVSQGQWKKLALVFQTKTTGTGGSNEQMDKIQVAYEGAKTDAERREVIKDMNKELSRREGLARVGLDDRQKAVLEQRMSREGLTDLPDTVRAK